MSIPPNMHNHIKRILYYLLECAYMHNEWPKLESIIQPDVKFLPLLFCMAKLQCLPSCLHGPLFQLFDTYNGEITLFLKIFRYIDPPNSIISNICSRAIALQDKETVYQFLKFFVSKFESEIPLTPQFFQWLFHIIVETDESYIVILGFHSIRMLLETPYFGVLAPALFSQLIYPILEIKNDELEEDIPVFIQRNFPVELFDFEKKHAALTLGRDLLSAHPELMPNFEPSFASVLLMPPTLEFAGFATSDNYCLRAASLYKLSLLDDCCEERAQVALSLLADQSLLVRFFALYLLSTTSVQLNEELYLPIMTVFTELVNVSYEERLLDVFNYLVNTFYEQLTPDVVPVAVSLFTQACDSGDLTDHDSFVNCFSATAQNGEIVAFILSSLCNQPFPYEYELAIFDICNVIIRNVDFDPSMWSLISYIMSVLDVEDIDCVIQLVNTILMKAKGSEIPAPLIQQFSSYVMQSMTDSSLRMLSILFFGLEGAGVLDPVIQIANNLFTLGETLIYDASRCMSSMIAYNPRLFFSQVQQQSAFDFIIQNMTNEFILALCKAFSLISERPLQITALIAGADCITNILSEDEFELEQIQESPRMFFELLIQIRDSFPDLYQVFNEETFPFAEELGEKVSKL